jgi:hypothetical protein
MMRSKSRLTPRREVKASLVQANVDSLTQGISQQPTHLRQVGQAERQVNAWSSPVEGLTKRRPTKYVNRLSTTPITDFFMEFMQVVPGETYSTMLYPSGGNMVLQLMNNGAAPAIDVHGTGMSIPVSPVMPGAVQCSPTSYLYNASGLSDKYVMINSGPLALLLNREKVTAMSVATTPAAVNEALLFIQGVAYEITYKVTLNGTALTAYTTPKATDTNNTISTTLVANTLASTIGAVSGFTVTQVGPVVHIKKTDGSNFSLSLDDGRSNTLARVVKGNVSTVGLLPVQAYNGMILKVDSNPADTRDDYWVKFVTEDPNVNIGPGSWQETVQPGQQYKLNVDTMPLVIYRREPNVIFIGPADGATRTITVGATTYSFTFPNWSERDTGNSVTVETPAFVGQAIRDHALFRGRYAVCAGQTVMFSKTDEPFTFFQDTSTQLQETDPFDVRAVSERGEQLNWLLPIDESLLAFSQSSQFQVRAADADVLTPRTAIILRLTNIDMNPLLRPKIAGPNVIFSTDEVGYTNFREYQFLDSQQRRLGLNLGGSLNISLNVPKYIKGIATHWDVDESLDYFLCSTPANKRKLYLYKYLYQVAAGGMGKSQASWSEWEFDGDVQWLRFLDSDLWLVMTYPDGTYSCIISADELQNTATPEVLLDRQLLFPECNANPAISDNVTATYDANTRLTTFVLPYQVQGETRAVIRFSNSRLKGLQLGKVSSGNTIVCDQFGNYTTDLIAIGRTYTMEYEFSTPYRPEKDQARSRIVGDLDGRLQLATWTTHHHNAGQYWVVIRRLNRGTESRHEFRSRRLNVLNNAIDTQATALEDGKLRVPVYSRNSDCSITVESDSWLPVTITGATWEGNYTDRSRSLN